MYSRRNFLRSAARGAAAATAGSVLPRPAMGAPADAREDAFPIKLGVATYSLRELNREEMIQALYRASNGVVRLDAERCVCCLACVGFCPIWAMRTHREHIEPFKCVACGSCARACPEDALRIEEVADVALSESARWAERRAV